MESLEGRQLLSVGDLDPTFGVGGKATIAFDKGGDLNDFASAVAIQGDKIVVVGGVERGSGNSDFGVARFNSDGSPDTSFGQGGKVTIDFDEGGDLDESASAVAIQGDKIVVVGGVKRGSGDSDFAIARLNVNGSLDDSFGDGGTATVAFDNGSDLYDAASAVVIQGDKIVVVGIVQQSSSEDYDFGVVRLNDSGSLDDSFGDGGTTTVAFDEGGYLHDAASDVAIQGDKIVVVGNVEMPGSYYAFGVARLGRDGRPDSSFGQDGKTTIAFDQRRGGRAGMDSASAVAIQGDQIIVVGSSEPDLGDSDFGVARLGRDGRPDSSFGQDGLVTLAFLEGKSRYERALDVAIQDGKIVVVGGVEMPLTDNDFGVARFNSDGSPDTSFGQGGKVTVAFKKGGDLDESASAVAIQGDQIVVVGGVAVTDPNNIDFGIARFVGTPPPVTPQPPVEQPPVVPPTKPVEPPTKPVEPPTKPVEPPPPPPPPSDATSPRLLVARPVFSGVGRKRKLAGFALTFSEPLNPATAQSWNFVLSIVQKGRRGANVAKPTPILGSSYDPTTNTVTLVPSKKAKFPRGAQITVLPGVADLAGNRINGGLQPSIVTAI